MEMHNIKRQTKRLKVRLHGRGGKRGKTAGRGTKGQNARAGRKFRPVMRDTIKKLPKLRGYANKAFAAKPVAINLADLTNFKKGETVNLTTLVEKGILNKVLGKMPTVKILGTGEISNALNFERVLVSKEARAKIEKAGGSVKEEKKAPLEKKKYEAVAA
jgi:large subunit ribosomal protein L15